MDKQQYMQKWYIENSVSHLKNVKKRLEAIKDWYYFLKIGKKCKICKIVCDKKHIKQFDFHHKNPEEKEFCISDAVASGYMLKRIKQELKKCEFLCEACHMDIS